ncbi:MAG: acyltransferase family protein, partial [Polyangiales bacterium]
DRLPVSCWDAFATGALIHIARLTTKSRKFWAWAVLILVVTTIGYGALLQSVQGPELGRAPSGLLNGVFDDRLFGFTLRNFWIACFLVAALEWRALRSVLSLPAVVLLGQISYGMYVFHWPILVPFRRLLAYEPVSPLGLLVFVAYSATVVAVSYASYRWFESWFLLRKLPYAKTPPPSQPEKTER